MPEIKQGKEEYGIFVFIDKKIWPENLHYFEVLLREGSGPVFEHRGPVMTFNSDYKAEEYARSHLQVPEVVRWRVEKIRDYHLEYLK